MICKNRILSLGGSTYDTIQFGRGKKHLVMIPGLGDGLITVKNKALVGLILYHAYASRYTVTLISRRNELTEEADTCSMARDQAAVMKALGIRQAHVIGVSQGGMIAQHLAADHPQLVDRLVLVVTVPQSSSLMRANAERWVRMMEQGDRTGLMGDINEKAHPEPYLRKIRWTYPILGWSVRKSSLRRFRIQARACMSHDARQKLGRITAPTLIIGGAEDQTLGPEGSLLLAKAIPGSQLKIYPHQGHALYEDEKAFNRDVLHFLENHH